MSSSKDDTAAKATTKPPRKKPGEEDGATATEAAEGADTPESATKAEPLLRGTPAQETLRQKLKKKFH